MADKMLNRTVGVSKEEITPLTVLADREMQVFRLIGQGTRTAKIAEQMRLSVKTVETYRDRIRHKLNLANGTELVHYATQWAIENG